MEIIIPPRDHGPSTYRYTWDENGEVSRIQRVNESVDYGDSRQTVQWPFQNVLESETSTSSSTSHTRPATWQPSGLHRALSNASSRFRDLIPDYIVNYIRGETPETLARKREEREVSHRRKKVREVEVEFGERHMSNIVEHDDWYVSNSSRIHTAQSAPTMVKSPSHILHSRNEKGSKGWRRLSTGWRGGLAINTIISFLILVAGFVCLIMAISKSQVLAGQSDIFTGSCAEAYNISWGIYAAVNIFCIALIGGANYALQVLSSPTRQEVTIAHDKKCWLDIGVPSFRNFKYISNTRVFIILPILLAAIFTQVIYNAVIFTSQAAVAHDILFVTQSFLELAPFSNGSSSNEGGLSRSRILNLQARAINGSLTNLTTQVCLAEFGATYQVDFDAVVLVTDLESSINSVLQTTSPGTSLSAYVSQGSLRSPSGSQVAYCLAEPSQDRMCNITLNESMLAVVAFLNLISVIFVTVALSKSSYKPLATLGDAISSFLQDPDPNTRGSCLMTKEDVWRSRWGLYEAKYWIPAKHYWFKTPSVPRWFVTALIWFVVCGLAAVGLAVSVTSSKSLTAFGRTRPQGALLLPTGTPTAGAAIVAALPQLLLGALYMATNALLTTYFLSHELSLFALAPHTLRVSSCPRGSQTMSLFLTLPRPWSWALISIFAGMGFVLSQSVFIVHVVLVSSQTSNDITDTLAMSNNSLADGDSTLVALGLSGVGLVTLLGMLVLLAAVVLSLGFRSAQSPGLDPSTGTPAANGFVLKGGSCSAVIAARCQRAISEPALSDVAGGVQWGVVQAGVGMNVGHCAFSARGVGALENGRSYA